MVLAFNVVSIGGDLSSVLLQDGWRAVYDCFRAVCTLCSSSRCVETPRIMNAHRRRQAVVTLDLKMVVCRAVLQLSSQAALSAAAVANARL